MWGVAISAENNSSLDHPTITLPGGRIIPLNIAPGSPSTVISSSPTTTNNGTNRGRGGINRVRGGRGGVTHRGGLNARGGLNVRGGTSNRGGASARGARGQAVAATTPRQIPAFSHPPNLQLTPGFPGFSWPNPAISAHALSFNSTQSLNTRVATPVPDSLHPSSNHINDQTDDATHDLLHSVHHEETIEESSVQEEEDTGNFQLNDFITINELHSSSQVDGNASGEITLVQTPPSTEGLANAINSPAPTTSSNVDPPRTPGTAVTIASSNSSMNNSIVNPINSSSQPASNATNTAPQIAASDIEVLRRYGVPIGGFQNPLAQAVASSAAFPPNVLPVPNIGPLPWNPSPYGGPQYPPSPFPGSVIGNSSKCPFKNL